MTTAAQSGDVAVARGVLRRFRTASGQHSPASQRPRRDVARDQVDLIE